MFRLCKTKLPQKHDQWFLTVNGELKVYCEKHYDMKVGKLQE